MVIADFAVVISGFFTSTWELFLSIVAGLPQYVAVMVVSVGCGLVIGLERESRGKPAGARTLVLICLGSAMFAHISVAMSGQFGDPARIAAQIVSGIGFLGAGAILHQKDKGYIAGLTTAATIWVTAAVGMIAGSGNYFFAVVGALAVLLALRMLRRLETRLFYQSNISPRKIHFSHEKGKSEWKLLGLLEDHMISPKEYKIVFGQKGEDHMLEIQYCRTNRNHRSFMADVANLKYVNDIT